MNRRHLYILLILTAFSFLSGCNKMEEEPFYNEVVSKGMVAPYCMIENNVNTRFSSGKLGTKSLVSQTTNTDDLLCNFLRLDQNDDGSFSSSTNFTTNWSDAYISEGTISSAESHDTKYLRTVSLYPVQPYNEGTYNEGNKKIRMIGWYPRTCNVPEDAQGNTTITQFNQSNFNSTYTNLKIGEADYIGVTFTGLDGSKDIMVSDVRDGSIDSPFNNENNYFKFKHYYSAIKVFAKAESSSQDLGMWGEITKVIVMEQPTTCTIALPQTPFIQDQSTGFAEKEHVFWGDQNAKLNIITTPIFGEQDNSAGNIAAEEYPISLGGSSIDHYLGYLLVKPNTPLRIQIHTTTGIHDVNLAAVKDEIPLFNAGLIYEIHLNFKTDGTIFTFLGNDGSEKFYDLTSGDVYVDDPTDQSHSYNYKYANCYIVKSNPAGSAQDPMYDGFCFDATIAGNGEKGVMSIGAQKLYPENVHLKPVSADVVWETSPRLVTQIELIMGYVRFKVAKDPNDPTKFMEGNAVIAVYDENRKVLWSWHIWITDIPQEVSYTEGTTTITLLDRNIGATAAKWDGAGESWGNILETYGLYYQWGRKDPSMGPPQWNYSPINMITAPYYDYSSDTYNAAEVVRVAQPSLKDGVENPMYLIMPTAHTQTYYFNWLYEKIDFLWGYNSTSGKTTKTIYDPCPYGYRVSGGELTDLIQYANTVENAYTLSDYGQKISVPTNSNNTSVKSDFYFPYAGYKGVDRGLNSLVCSWRYVGEKADYQSAVVSTFADDPEYFMHRTRIYLSKNRTWSETGVGNYTGHQITDHTNRKTAAPVRCVKNVELNRVMAFITPDRGNVPNTENSVINFTLHAESFGVPITSASLIMGYHNKENPEVHNKIPIVTWNENQIENNSINKEGYIWNLIYTFNFENYQNIQGVDLSNTTGELRFILNVKNQSNIQKMSSTTILVSANDYISFDEWESGNTVLVGEKISRVVRLYGDSKPVKVEMIIDGDTGNAIDITENLVEIGGDAYENIWYCTTNENSTFAGLSFTTAGKHTVQFKVTYENVNDPKISETKDFIVKGMQKVTSIDEINNNISANYVIKHVASGLYAYDGGNNINVKSGVDNSCFFKFERPYSDNSYRILNVASQNYANLSVSWNSQTLSISGTTGSWATRFALNYSNGQFNIYNNGYYWYMQNNATNVTVRNNDNNTQTKWEIYRIID